MYLHLGNDVVVKKSEIVAVFDLDNSTWSHRTRQTLKQAEQAGAVTDAAGGELPRSLVLCDTPGGTRLCLSQLNSSTLARRAEGGELI